MGEELKACPFCGSKAEMVTNRSGDNFVRCANRQCAAKTRLYHENEAGARIAWNKRAEPWCERDALLAIADRMEEMSGKGAYLAPDGLGAAASSIREALEEPAL